MKQQERKYWLDDPRNVDKIFWGLVLACALLALADVGGIVYHKHVHLLSEGFWNFYGLYGFFSCWVLVVAAKQLRKLVMRKEDFYD